jgi:hypothetical protein
MPILSGMLAVVSSTAAGSHYPLGFLKVTPGLEEEHFGDFSVQASSRHASASLKSSSWGGRLVTFFSNAWIDRSSTPLAKVCCGNCDKSSWQVRRAGLHQGSETGGPGNPLSKHQVNPGRGVQ